MIDSVDKESSLSQRKIDALRVDKLSRWLAGWITLLLPEGKLQLANHSHLPHTSME